MSNMNEQEQSDIFKVMNVSDLPDRYFVYNEQKPNFLTPGYLELEPDPLPPLIEECIRNRPSDIYFSPDDNNNNNDNENNSCTNDNKDDTDMCHNESGYLLSRTDLSSSLIQKKLIYQQKILTVPINSSCTNRSSISNLSNSTTTTNNNNILNQISLINNNNNNKSSKNSPNLLYV
jgi:hypothetical protein